MLQFELLLISSLLAIAPNHIAVEMEDYTSVNDVVQFDLGDERKEYTLRITGDQRCEDTLESFYVNLIPYESNVTLVVSTAQVFIRDTRCGECYV